ncbi:hypothetical protein C8R44DRAFT_800978 [Mycena epipterygia]|nr:hypothetical protein C8R44DRAFT_800978 [Mycena epipterygia]
MTDFIGFRFQKRVFYYHIKGQDVTSYKEAVDFCRHPDVFDIDEGVEIEFLFDAFKDGTPGVVKDSEWGLIRPGYVLLVQRVPQHTKNISPPISLYLMSPRANLVQGIIDQLNKVNFIQIRGSPASGKTIFLHLIQQRLEKEGKTVVRIDEIWPLDPSKRTKLHAELCGYRNSALSTRNETVILIDEGQASYLDLTLWNTFFKAWAADVPGPFRIIIACSYGSVTPHVMTSGPYTPISLQNSQRIGLRRSSDSSLALLFDKAEVDELFALAVDKKVIPRIDEPLRELIFRWTDGYISVVTAILKMITRKKQYIRDNQIYTLHEFSKDYSQETFFGTVVADGQCRRFLATEAVAADPRVIRVFSRLLVDGIIEYEEGDQWPGGLDRGDLDFTLQRGLIYPERASATSLLCRISFSFPLHRGLLQMSLQPPIPDPLGDIPTLFSLVTQVIRRFNSDHLTSPKRVGGIPQDLPLEATYQHEFYRCLYQMRPRALFSAEYSTPIGYTPAGRIDFLVHRREIDDKQRSWGMELLKDSDRVHEHAFRFGPTGAYHSMVSDGIADFIIIDFRTTVPTKMQPSIPDLLHVVFAQDYTSVVFYDHNNIECGSYPLLRR